MTEGRRAPFYAAGSRASGGAFDAPAPVAREHPASGKPRLRTRCKGRTGRPAPRGTRHSESIG